MRNLMILYRRIHLTVIGFLRTSIHLTFLIKEESVDSYLSGGFIIWLTETEFYGVHGDKNININTDNKDIDFIINAINERI